jgi:hypothetical protein
MLNWKLFTLARIVATSGIVAWGVAGGQFQTPPDWNGSVRDVSGGVASKAELVLQGNGNRYSAVATEGGSFHFGAGLVRADGEFRRAVVPAGDFGRDPD